MSVEVRRRSVILTPEQKRRHEEIRRQVEADKPRLSRAALQRKAEMLAIINAFRQLKARREALGLSLGGVAQRTGIDKSYLAKLEKDPYPNPTMETLQRIAGALGGVIEVSFRPAA